MPLASLVAQTVKSLPAMRETRFDPRVRKIPWRREWQPTPVLLPGKSHGWRSLAGYSPCGLKELDTTERLHFHLCTWRGQGATAIITLSCKHLQLNSLINLFCSYQRIHLSTPSRSVQLTQWPRGYSITHEHAPLKGTHQLMGVPLCVY